LIEEGDDPAGQFYIAETTVGAHVTNKHWEAVEARTLDEAKKIAGEKRFYQITEMHVGHDAGSGIKHLSSYRPDNNINANTRYRWHDN
jgi:hypothetical protein